MKPIPLEQGQVFGRLTIVERSPVPTSGGGRAWICKCSCGNTKTALTHDLTSGAVASCGCLKREMVAAKNKDRAISLEPGQRFGKLTVIGPSAKRLNGAVHWECRCDCGTVRHVATHDLVHKSRSCGCTKLIATRMANTTHGHKTNYETTLTYNSWRGMISRCRNNPYYAGITVCDAWTIFENFVNDMGPRPSQEHWLDRVDPAGNYTKENCRWLEGVANWRNKRDTVWVVYNGERMTLLDVAQRLYLPYAGLLQRVRRGESIEQATTELPYLSHLRTWLKSPHMRELLQAELNKFNLDR